MSLNYLLAGSIIDFPVLNETSFSTKEHVVIVNLEDLSRWRIQIEGLKVVFSLGFQVNAYKVHECFPVVCKAKNC